MESCIGPSNNSNPPRLPSLTPSMCRGPSFSSSFNTFFPFTYHLQMGAQVSRLQKKIFFLTLKLPHKTFISLIFFPNFSNLWSAPTFSISFPSTHSFLTCRLACINILLLNMCFQGHQWPSHPLIFLGIFPQSSHLLCLSKI